MSEMTDVPESGDNQAAVKWWRSLADARGSRSALRRASSIDEIVAEGAFYGLLTARQEEEGRTKIDNLACVAGVLAHVTDHDPSAPFGSQLATQFSTGASGDLRFRRLLAIENSDRDELLTAMVRVVRLMRGRANVIDLAEKVYWWNERARRDLAYEFYTTFRD